MLNFVVDLTEYLMISGNSPRDIAKYTAIRTFAEYSTKQLEISLLSKNSHLTSVGSWAQFEIDSSPKNIHVTDSSPIAEAFRTNKIIVSEELPLPPRKSEIKHRDVSIHFPMSTTGCIRMICDKVRFHEVRDDNYLRLVGSILAFKFLRDLNLNENVRRSSTYQSNNKLTDRQSIITVEIANGLSNREIAAKIGYSESLVRQETIQIYKALQIVGRNELVANPNLFRNSKTGG